MKKKMFIIIPIILVIILIVGVVIFIINKKPKSELSDEVKEKQEIVIKNIGVSNKKRYVLKNDNKYMIYFISDNEYTQYFYILHKSESEYKAYKEDYRGQLYYQLRFDDDAYLTILKVNEGQIGEDFEKTITEKNKGYEKI